MKEMNIDSLRVSLINYQRLVLLKEKNADRYLPIWIGPAEADAIAVKLQGVDVPRPLTHDLVTLVIQVLGGRVESIIVSDLKNDTFYAKVNLTLNGHPVEIDSRPSDALALAVRADAPIYVEEAVLNQAGLSLEQESVQPGLLEGDATEAIEGSQQAKKPISKAELDQMSAYADFIKTLNLDDLDKRKS
jgi:bifunctional DNase/RNase